MTRYAVLADAAVANKCAQKSPAEFGGLSTNRAHDVASSNCYFCVSVRVGSEETFARKAEEFFFKNGEAFARVVFLKKRMRLKSGKEYDEPFFPGYIFLEAGDWDAELFSPLKTLDGFCRFLPENLSPQALSGHDEEIVKSILAFGETIGIVPARFDENDRIVLVSGPFQGCEGKVVSVNRRNRRLNIQLDFMGGVKVVNLSYEEVARAET
ncbi:MAG: hypothetical protein NC548_65335, partial [Lachnospiraceae bacterium]|nr:hypothetical protein [Lachnospiraceae bacterium]